MKPLIIIILVCCVSNLHAFVQAGNETDRLALLDIKSKVTDDPLGILSSWNESIHFCQWHGVTCGARHQRVTELDLQSQNLAGFIPPHIGNLSFLRVLQLQNNSFRDEIPPELGNLHRLQILHLHNNSLTGQIPVNISACSSLFRINFAHNMLVGNIPVQLGLLSNLQALSLGKNNFTGGIPSSLGNLSSFNDLRASYNNLDGTIPETLGQLTNLTFLGISFNRLSNTIPAPIFNLTTLQEFQVSYNNIQGSLPLDFGINLPKLRTLGLRFNRLTGPIPVSITNASSLLNIIISGNKFAGKLPTLEGLPNLHHLIMSLNSLGTGEADDSSFLSSLTNATQLEELSMDGNNLGGVLPNSISNFSTRLLRLSLANNRMFGSIPTGMGNLISLETIDIRGNQFSGKIPDEIGNLQKLKLLSTFDNKLLGNIPSSLGNLSMLIDFDLGKNDLQGSIPSSLGKCQGLLRLELAQNKLSGMVPKEVMSITTLAVLNLSQNKLTGSLPMEFGNLINLEQLDVSENMFSGQIPSSLGSCVRVEALYMQGNFFQGKISSLNSLRGIQSLDLSHNNLSGQIPNFLEDLKFLQTLNLSFNDFEGSVPTQGVFKNVSAISVIGNNKLCGGVPELQLPICNLKGSTKRRLSLTVKIIIFTVFGLLGLCLCLLLFCWFPKRRLRPPSISQENSLLKVSYQSLLKATDGFASINLIGSGSSGSVYKGILDHQNGTRIAVKVLNLHCPGASKSFLAECEALRNIKHRNLVKVLTACSGVDYEGNNFKALVYEFMVNGSLEKWLHVNAWDVEANVEPRKKLDLLQRLNIAIDVACAVDYLHNGCQTPIVHCDLKPSNVLLDGEMTAHVGDFGLARFTVRGTGNLFGNETSTSSIGIKGSIGYAAPEYGMGSMASTYGDVYSYGILLLEMFTGKRPTDEMFKDNLSLHNFAKMAMPKKVAEIADPILLEREEGETHDQNHVSSETMQECMISIFKIGISCSVESPRERLDMSDVVAELHLIRNILVGTGGLHGGRSAKHICTLSE